jgi:hypothetical protein
VFGLNLTDLVSYLYEGLEINGRVRRCVCLSDVQCQKLCNGFR